MYLLLRMHLRLYLEELSQKRKAILLIFVKELVRVLELYLKQFVFVQSHFLRFQNHLSFEPLFTEVDSYVQVGLLSEYWCRHCPYFIIIIK